MSTRGLPSLSTAHRLRPCAEELRGEDSSSMHGWCLTPRAEWSQMSRMKRHDFSGSVLPVSAAGISTGLPARAGMKRKKAFAGVTSCDAEESLTGAPEITLYISCCESFLQSFVKKAHMHYPKSESELAWPCQSSPVPFKGLATTTPFCLNIIMKPSCGGQILQSLCPCLSLSPLRRCPPAPAHPPPVTVSLCMELQ